MVSILRDGRIVVVADWTKEVPRGELKRRIETIIEEWLGRRLG
jgi:hypothetical protein